MSKKTIITGISSTIIMILLVSGFITVLRSKTQIREIFWMNKELQKQNYYMAEFEYKLLGIAYELDKGHYRKALSQIDNFHNQLKTKNNLIKVPEFKNKDEEFEFYLNLQNPRTGAFIDDSYPSIVYHGPTSNVLLHLHELAKEINQNLTLKYPLQYLDDINTPDKLKAFLDEASTVGWIASKLPQTTFHNARDLLDLCRDEINYDENQFDMVVQKHHLYNFSPEWRHSMLKWFYNAQDPETGLWGPKSKSGKLLKKDLSNTASIMKAFVDKNGNDIHKEFPLRYKNKLFESTLEALAIPPKLDGGLDRLHEWNLRTPKTMSLLTRYLLKTASLENKIKAQILIENLIRVKCENYYIPEEGAFSYYPGEQHATLDGTSGFFIFNDIGAFSSKKQNDLWGRPEKTIMDLGTIEVTEISDNDFYLFNKYANLNSLRIYKTKPKTEFTTQVFAVVYLKKTPVPDIFDITPKIKQWVKTTPQTMGNWVSKSSIRKRLEALKVDNVPVYNTIPTKQMNEVFLKNGELVVIGYDILQVPRYKIIFTHISK